MSVDHFPAGSFWARRVRGSSLYFSVQESSTCHEPGGGLSPPGSWWASYC